jgi:hypothetical protein
MNQETGDRRQPLGHTRQVTVDALCEHFANDAMSVEEFERRVELAHRAATVEDLKSLLEDLPGAGVPAVRQEPAPEPRTDRSVTAAAHVKERETMVAILGGATRKGAWTPARQNYAVAVCGGAHLDFREAVFGPGVTDLRVLAMWGGVEIIVPPGINVESHGIGILGGFEHRSEHTYIESDTPTLRISGVAVMGGVDIHTRYAGETARDARRRQRLERKERRRLGPGA